jgi:hypothetical protein
MLNGSLRSRNVEESGHRYCQMKSNKKYQIDVPCEENRAIPRELEDCPLPDAIHKSLDRVLAFVDYYDDEGKRHSRGASVKYDVESDRRSAYGNRSKIADITVSIRIAS